MNKADRSAPGQRYKRPESVLVVVYTTAGSTLLLERSIPTGFWQSVTGSLEAGETPAAAAARELTEETGIAAIGLRDLEQSARYPIASAWRARYAPDVTHNVEHYFACCVSAPTPITLAAHEHVSYAWLSFEDAITRVSSPSNRGLLERITREMRS
jgi:dATP pyrophosphohydrolase